MNVDNIDNEDEDVVIQGSYLYEHLHDLGYIDFESVPVSKSGTSKGTSSILLDFLQCLTNGLKKALTLCLRTIQDDDSVSKKQVGTLLTAQFLLSDHALAINQFLDNKYDSKPWKTTGLRFISIGTLLSSSMYISYNNRYRSPATLFTLIVLCYIACMKCLRAEACRDFKSLLIMQNDLFNLCKKGLKILKYGYKIKLNRRKSTQQFYNLTADRLKYFQPMVEEVIKCLEGTSFIYYSTSLILLKLLPANIIHEDLLTKFDPTSFQVRGEIDYRKLKTLYHTYVLAQSEMSYLLAIAYDNRTWQQSYNKIPELKLSYIIRFLIERLTTYKNKLSEIIDVYYSFKMEPMQYKYNGPLSSQWQDLYMHLYLASNKLQLAYSHVLSVLQDIDNVNETIGYEESVEDIGRRLNAAQKDIENAKDFVEFSNLFLVKTHINSYANNRTIEKNVSASAPKSDVPIVRDTEPQIFDEVFEEYIKDEYLKPLIEDSDEISLFWHKRDKSLFKNFMSELKDVLVDKQKVMSEREAKALQRMYKNMMKEANLDDQDHSFRIPPPPPMPSADTLSLTQKKSKASQAYGNSIDRESEESDIVKSISGRQTNFEEKFSIPIITLPKNKEFSSFLPPAFLKDDEETFVGSGENSEEDIDEIVNNDDATNP